MDLYLLSSPLQALHANHYRLTNQLDAQKSITFIFNKTKQETSAIQDLFKSSRTYVIREPRFSLLRIRGTGARKNFIRQVCYALVNETGVFLVRWMFVLKLFFIFSHCKGPFKRVIVGDFRSVAMRQVYRFLDLKKTECILLDDGSITPEIMAYRHNGSYADEIVSRVAVHSRKLVLPDPYFYDIPESFTFFTIYQGEAGPRDTVSPNNCYQDAGKRTYTIRDEAWLCGSNHVETGICSIEAYARQCSLAADFCSKTKIWYYPHRRELPEKVKCISQSIGASMGSAPFGLELEIISSQTAPRTIISFGSTLLDTLPLVVSERVEFVLFIPENEYFTGKRQDHILNVMRRNLSGPRIIGLFAADSNAATRMDLTNIRRNPAGSLSILPHRTYVLQVVPDHLGRATLQLMLAEKQLITLSISPEKLPHKGDSSSTLLVYRKKHYSDYFGATIPVAVYQRNGFLHIETNCEGIDLAIQEAISTKKIHPNLVDSKISRVLEVGECTTNARAGLLYSLALPFTLH